MNRDELARRIAERERLLGLRPGEFSAIWGQESTESLDPNKQGPELSRNRGRAQGPFQVVPYYHPDFPVGGPLGDQLDYASSLYAKGGDTPEKRMIAYYGSGTVPAGHPSPQQYVQQVSARMNGGGAMPVDYQQNPAAQMAADPTSLQGILAALAPQAQKEPGFMEKWLGNPLTQMGMGILAAPGNYGNWAGAIGTGMMMGGNNYARMEALKQERSDRQQQQQLQSLKVGMELQQRARQQAYLQQLAQQNPQYAAAINAGFGNEVVGGLLGLKPSEVKEFEEGNDKVTKQWDPASGTWKEIARGPRWSPNAGFAITGYDEQGRPLMQMGGNPSAMGKPTVTELQKSQINLTERMAALRGIQSGFKPEYQEIGNQLASSWAGLKDRFGRLKPHEAKQYEDYWSWRSQTRMALNEEIKRITGAAMSEGEAGRILGALPNPGTSLTDPGDSPREFESKLRGGMELTKKALIRNRLTQKYGLNWQDIPLEQVDDKLVDRYYDELKQAALSQGMPEDEAVRQALTQISQEFEL